MEFPNITEENCFEDIKSWIQRGGYPDVRHPISGETLLHVVAEFQCVEAVEFLTRHGCEINATDIYGQTPLHIAVDSEIDTTVQTDAPLLYKTTKILIEFGADLTVKNNRGESPIDWINNYGEKARSIFDEVMKR